MSASENPTGPTSVFISYARADDPDFAQRLYRDLTEAGFEVWWDRESLHTQQLTFHQQIKDAIHTRIDRMIYVAGPKAAISEYVREEWKFALECDKPVIPILRMGDYDTVPGELSLIHCDDFRDDSEYPRQLARLIENLRRPLPPMGHLHAVPELPKAFLGRPVLMKRVKEALLVDLQRSVVVSAAGKRVGMQGMGGIGKSVLAAAMSRDPEVRRAFPDGIVWIHFGQTPDLVQLQRDLASVLKGDVTIQSEAQGRSILRELLSGKKLLLVLDDVWQAVHTQAFDVLGPRCRALVTTRDGGLVESLGGELYPIELLDEKEALKLIAEIVNLEVAQLPNEARELVRECGFLPLALSLSASMARKQGGQWDGVLARLRNADLKKIEDRHPIEEQHRSLWKAMQASVSVLERAKRKRFAELCVFATGIQIPEVAVETLWGHTGSFSSFPFRYLRIVWMALLWAWRKLALPSPAAEFSTSTTLDTRELLVELFERSLVQLETKPGSDGQPGQRYFRLHDLLYDYACRTSGNRPALHRKLLDAYRKRCPNDWPSGPDDGYYLQYLCHHLREAGQANETVRLLTDTPWIEAKCRAHLVFDLLKDYRETIAVLPEAQAKLAEEKRRQQDLDRWTDELTRYSRAWSERRDRTARAHPFTAPEPQLPVPPPACRMWTEEEIEAESRRIVERPTALDRMEAFAGFVRSEAYPLLQFGDRAGFVVQHAFNHAPAGPVHDRGNVHRHQIKAPMLLRRWPENAEYYPKPALLSTLEGHSAWVLSVSVTPDGRRAVSGSYDKTVRVWDLESGKCLRTLEGYSHCVLSVSVTPDGRRAVSGSDDQIHMWDLESGTCLRILKGHISEVWCVSVTPDGCCAVSGSSDKTVRVWDMEGGKCLRILQGHGGKVSSVSVTPDGRCAVSGSSDKTVRVWNVEGGECLRVLQGHSGEVSSVSVTPDGRYAVSGSLDKTVRVWDLESGTCLRTLEGHSDLVWSVSVTPDRRRVVSGSYEQTVRLWDLESGTYRRTLEGHSTWVLHLNMSVTPNGRRAVSVSDSKTLYVWDVETGRCLRTLKGQISKARGVSVTGDGRRAVSGSDDKTVRVWDLESGTCLHTLEGHSSGVLSVSVTGDGRRAVSGSLDNTVRVWDLESGTCLRTLEGHSLDVSSVSVASDGHRAVSGSSDRTVRVWDVESGMCLRTLKGHHFGVRSVSMTSNGRRAASGGSYRTIRVWDVESGTCLRTLEGHRSGVWSVSVTSDGRRAASGSEDNTVRVWDLESGECLGVYAGQAPALAVALADQGRILCVGTDTGEVLFLDVRNIDL